MNKFHVKLSFGQAMRKAREGKGLTLKDVSLMTGIPDEILINFEKVCELPSQKDALDIAYVLDMGVSEIFDLEKDAPDAELFTRFVAYASKGATGELCRIFMLSRLLNKLERLGYHEAVWLSERIFQPIEGRRA